MCIRDRFGGLAVITDYPLEAPYDDAMTYSLSLEGMGPLVDLAKNPVKPDTMPEGGSALAPLTVVSVAGADASGKTNVYVNPVKTGENKYFYKTGKAPLLYPGYGEIITETAWNGLESVSYTHLDVYKRQIQEVSNMNLKGKKTKNQVVTANIFEQQELLKKAEVIREKLTASTWHELETNGKFDKNAKLSFISDDMLILGCDVGSETHYLRAIDPRGRELSKSAYSFRNNCEGFQSAKEWAVELAAKNEKKQIVLGLEPTGHYWFCLLYTSRCV